SSVPSSFRGGGEDDARGASARTFVARAEARHRLPAAGQMRLARGRIVEQPVDRVRQALRGAFVLQQLDLQRPVEHQVDNADILNLEQASGKGGAQPAD